MHDGAMSLLDFFRRPEAAAANPLSAAPKVAPDPGPDEDLLRYPPFIKGLPVATVDALLGRQSELIRRLQDGVGMTNEDYRVLFLPVVRRFAAFVHLLPASESHHHRGAGGLLRHSLEVAFLASQASMRHVFALEREPQDRYHLEPRWRGAAGLAGLLHDLGKPVADLTVSDRDGALTWSPYEGPLNAWAHQHGLDRYFLRWRDARQHNAHVRLGTLVLHHVLTPQIENWLGRDPAIIANLIAVVGGQEQASIVSTLVANADRASVEQDLRENRIDPNACALGVPVDRYLIDAMRRLVRDGAWTVNTPGSRLWMFTEGLHVVWPQGGDDLYGVLAEDNVPGIPRSPETIADVLVECGHVLTYREAGRERFYRRLAPAPLVKDGEPVYLSMLRLASPELVFPGHPPAPVGLWQQATPTPSVSRPQTGAERPQRPDRSEPVWPANANDGDEGDGEQADPRGAPDDALGCAPNRAANPPPADKPTAGARTIARSLAAPVPAAQPANEPADPKAAACAWLTSHGAGGGTLMALVDAMAAGRRPGDCLATRGRNLLIPYPEGLTDLAVAGDGEPPSLLATLWDAGLVVVDARRPLLRVREIDGRMWAMLTAEASAAVAELLERGEFPAPAAPIVATGMAVHPVGRETGQAPARTQAGASPRPTGVPKAPSRGNTSRAVADALRALCEGGQVPTEQVAEGLLIEHATLTGVAAQRGVPPSKLLRLLQFQPDIKAHPRGLVLLARA